MKKTLYLICLSLALVAPSHFALKTSASVPAETPKAAAERLMESVISWDAQASATILGENVPKEYVSLICDAIAPRVLSSLEYEIGSSRITGGKAVVDISVTAADIKDLSGEIILRSIGYAAIQKLLGLPVDVADYTLGQFTEALEDESLTTIRTDASVYLVLGGDGKWSLDMADSRNLGFAEAVSGGIIDFEDAVKAMLEGM